MTEGLFILSPTYAKASYLEGTVTDQSTSLPLLNVSVQIESNDQLENTSSIGFYATGSAVEGTYDVTYSKVGYFPQTISVNLNQGLLPFKTYNWFRLNNLMLQLT